MKLDPKTFFLEEHLEFAIAIQGEDFKKMDSLQKRIDINHVGKEDMTFIMWAIVNKSKRSLKKLLQMGANPNRVDLDGKTPVAFVCAGKNTDYLEILLKYNGNPNVKMKNGEPAIVFAAIHGTWKNVNLLVQAGSNIDTVDKDGYTVAMVYASLRDFDNVYNTIILGTSIIKKNSVGDSLIDLLREENKNGQMESYSDFKKLQNFLHTKNINI